MRILIIEPNERLADVIRTLLCSKGYHAETAGSIRTDSFYTELSHYDLLILDETTCGAEHCRLIRQIRAGHCCIPILMLTSKTNPLERVECLNSGADYCLSKPFDSRELLACIHALLRRQGDQIDILSYGNTTLELSTCILSCGDRRVRLSSREFDVMRLLMQAGRRNLSKETILLHVWGYDSNAVENHVEVYVGFLRRKLTGIGSNIKIKGIRRMGYHLEAAASDGTSHSASAGGYSGSAAGNSLPSAK